MAFEYRYEIYRPLQVPGHLDGLNKLCSEEGGWHVHTVLPNYGEVYVLLERELPANSTSGRRRKADNDEAPSARPGSA